MNKIVHKNKPTKNGEGGNNLAGRQYLIDFMGIDDIWRVFRIMAEFAESFETLGPLPDAVTVFGSARTPEDHPLYAKARELGRRISREGFATVTGGGPGIMEAANRGAYEADGCSVGLNIELPLEQEPNPYITTGLSFRYFFVRKVMLVKYSIAFVIFPGGFGTLDELFESLTLIQTHRVRRFPVILFDTAYWDGLLAWLKNRLLEDGNISPEDLELIQTTDSLDETMEMIKKSELIARSKRV
ncbi:MAG: TIGR00730 family Rossman fold protein [Candidatus Omnitrophota bacterium]